MSVSCRWKIIVSGWGVDEVFEVGVGYMGYGGEKFLGKVFYK